MPLAIPVQRDWHRADPRTYQRAQPHPVQLVDWHLQAGELEPGRRVEAVRVEEVRGGQKRDVQREEGGVRVVRCDGGAEEDGEGREEGGCQGKGQEEGEGCGL